MHLGDMYDADRNVCSAFQSLNSVSHAGKMHLSFRSAPFLVQHIFPVQGPEQRFQQPSMQFPRVLMILALFFSEAVAKLLLVTVALFQGNVLLLLHRPIKVAACTDRDTSNVFKCYAACISDLQVFSAVLSQDVKHLVNDLPGVLCRLACASQLCGHWSCLARGTNCISFVSSNKRKSTGC